MLISIIIFGIAENQCNQTVSTSLVHLSALAGRAADTWYSYLSNKRVGYNKRVG